MQVQALLKSPLNCTEIISVFRPLGGKLTSRSLPLKYEMEELRETMRGVLQNAQATRDRARSGISEGVGEVIFSHTEVATDLTDTMLERVNAMDNTALVEYYIGATD